MNNRDKILSSIPVNAESVESAIHATPHVTWEDRLGKFCDVLKSIGGAVIETQSYSGVREYILQHFEDKHRIVSVIPLDRRARTEGTPLHPYDNVEVCVIRGHFGVCENGAVWITDDLLPDRVLPFICQHLIIALNRYDLVNTMHDAYQRIGMTDYDFGSFIAGPSKTADIEQSLVLGAHGPRTLTIFLLENTPD